MRYLTLNELSIVNGGSHSSDLFDDISSLCGLVISSTLAGGAAGHIGANVLGYQLASYAGASFMGAICCGTILGVAGAYAGAYLLSSVNLELYSWAKDI